MKTKKIEFFNGCHVDAEILQKDLLQKWLKPEVWDSTLSHKTFLLDGKSILKPMDFPEAYFYLYNPEKKFLRKVGKEEMEQVDERASGTTEKKEYKNFANCPDELRSIVPKFNGLKICGGNELFISIENLMLGMKNPAILDIKIGTRSGDPFCSTKKFNFTSKKFAKRIEFGFRVVGMQTWNNKTGYTRNNGSGDKTWGRGLINWKKGIEGEVASNFVEKMTKNQKQNLLIELNRLINVWEQYATKETGILIFSSSLLIVYDAAKGIGNDDQKNQSSDLLRVKLLDFNHSFYRHDHPNVEDGVLHGLKNVKKAFENVIKS